MATAEADPGSCVSLQVALQAGWLPVSKPWHYCVAGACPYRRLAKSWSNTDGLWLREEILFW